MGVTEQIYKILDEALEPEHLEVINDSGRHSGHAGDDGSGESHFTIEITTPKFDNISRIERHRVVYDLLRDKMQNLPHALAIKAKGTIS